MRHKHIYVLVSMLLLSGTLFAQVKIGGDVYGGCELGKVTANTQVEFNGGSIGGTIYGGGMGNSTDASTGCVLGNTSVTMTDGYVDNGIFGGGLAGSVGTFTRSTAAADANIFGHTTHEGCLGKPTACAENTGKCTIVVTGGQIGPVTVATVGMDPDGPEVRGWVWGGSCGVMDDPATHPDVHFTAYVGSTDVTIGGTAFIMEGVIGGGEFGRVLGNTLVKIQDHCQIGVGENQTETVNGVQKPKRYTDGYDYGNGATTNQFIDPTTTPVTVSNALPECSHFNYGRDTDDDGKNDEFLPYDPYFERFHSPAAFAPASTAHPSNGGTWIGVVFGGGSGYMPYLKDDGTGYDWCRSAGWVEGNTEVQISGGHILTNVYGGNEYTDVKGSSTVTMTGGTIGVPRTLEQIVAHPVTCYLFGAGKGDEREHFSTLNNVGSTVVTVSGGLIYGSVFGGGEDGHVLGNSSVTISGTAKIGTTGTSYVDGNVFGGGRGFSGTSKTAGVVQGNINVNITGGTMLGSVYGGGRLASVGAYVVEANDGNYGKMREDVPDDPEMEGDQSQTFGHITVNISGGTIGNPDEYVYPTNAQRDASTGSLRFTLFHSTNSSEGANQLMHTKGGNVFGGSMGRIVSIDGITVNPYWPTLGHANYSIVNISGGTIKSCVFGGGEMGSMANNTTVNITGGTIGTRIPQTASASGHTGGDAYNFGYVYGGGYGSLSTDATANDSTTARATERLAATPAVLAGRVFGNTEVNITDGTILSEVYGGGEMASVGHENTTTRGNTLVNIGSSTISGDDYTGSATIVGRNVYGANNIIGTPYGNAEVHIYKSYRNDTTDEADYPGGSGDPTFALDNVFGGGHMADYAPSTQTSHRASVYVHGCKNTIEDVFGGGDAAAAYGAGVTIDGGRFYRVFGGGNGEVTAANIGAGGTLTEINGGIINQLFGGSNEQGSISGPLNTTVANNGSCTENITEFYAGSNMVDIVGDLNTTIACNTTDPVDISKIYGGCKQADIYGSISLTINGGSFTEVYGGSMGTDLQAADIKRFDASHLPVGYPSDSIGHGGNVTLNLYGGTITDAFGGSNVNGNVEGVITVNVDSSTACPLTITHNLYGGGNLATNNATGVDVVSPIVNLINGTVDNDVFGGGKGTTADATKGTTTSTYVHMTGVRSFRVMNKLYGGGEIGNVSGNAHVDIDGGTVRHTVYGGGKGDNGYPALGSIAGNTRVEMSAGNVDHSVYGGGELGSVGTFTATYSAAEQTASNGLHVEGEPKTCASGTGRTEVYINGTAQVGVINQALMPPPDPEYDDYGYVFAAGDGEGDSVTYPNANILAVVNTAYLEIGGNALVTSAAYGGSENGLVLDSTHVKITGTCQIGVGYNESTNSFDAKYTEQQWAAVNTTTFNPSAAAEFHECSHWPYEAPYAPYDPEALWVKTGEDTYAAYNPNTTYQTTDKFYYRTGAGEPYTYTYAEGGRPKASNGHTFYGLVFGGGCGVYPIAPGLWRRSAGRVNGNTRVEMDGGHILTNLYGGNELTDVLGSTTVVMSGGTIGVPRTVAQCIAHPLTGYLFGGCKGDQRIFFNQRTNVQSVKVTVTGGHIFGSVLGGGEDGHVLGNTLVDISDPVEMNNQETPEPLPENQQIHTIIGTQGLSYVDGNVFGGGRGFGGDALTAGVVCGNTTVNISGGSILGTVYGGGRLASVGTYLVPVNDANYGQMKPGSDHGFCQVNISGGTIGATTPYLYYSEVDKPADLVMNEYDDQHLLTNPITGNVYGGGMGRLYLLDGTTVSPIWDNMARAKKTRVTISGTARILSEVYGGGELGTVIDSATVNILGGTIGSWTNVPNSGANSVNVSGKYYFGSVYGGGYGSTETTVTDAISLAGRIYGNSYVYMTGGKVTKSVYGGGEVASVGPVSPASPSDTIGKGRCVVRVLGGTIGNDTLYSLIGEDDGTVIAAFYNDEDNGPDQPDAGHVYGGGKGETDETNYKLHSNYNNTYVLIDKTNSNDGPRIYGSVYGGSANGHVTGSTVVKVHAGTIGTHGLSSWDGHVFGGGEGSGHEVYDDANGNGTYENDEYDHFEFHPTCGRVEGNTNVTVDGGMLYGSIYGGGRLALTGVDVNGDYFTPYDTILHGKATVLVQGTTTAIGNPTGATLLASDFSLGDVFGSGRGDVEYYENVLAGRVANAHITVSGAPTIRGAVFGGGEMAGVGYWSDAAGHPFVTNTGTSTVNISGGTIGTPYEFTAGYLANAGAWTVITPDGQGGGRLTHSCTGNIIGGSQGDVDLSCPAWISMGRSRQTYVDISGTPVIMGNVYGGAEQGVVTENTHVNVRGGTIGTLIPEFTVDEDDDPTTTTDRTTYKRHYFGSVFGGGYGSERWWDTVHVESTPVYCYNDSCLFSSTDHSRATMTHYTAATQIAGRVYGNTYVDITGGTIHENVYGGGNMASVGYVEKDASGDEQLLDSTKWHGGVCNVTIGGNAVIGPLDGTELNACVYGAGKGVGNDPDDPTTAANEENFLRYCNVTSTNLIVKGGFIDGSTFGGGADCHVLRHTNTTVCNTVADAAYHQAHNDVEEGTLLAIPIIGSGQIVDLSDDPDGYSGYEQEYDGCVIGGGRNALNANHTAGRVQGHTRVTVTGGRIKRSVIGGGALARTGVDVNGLVTSFTSGIVYDSLHHGSTFVSVSGDTLVVPAAEFNSVTINGKTYKEIFSGTTVPKGGDSIVYLTTIGAPNGPILVDNDYTIGDIFGGGKGDTKDTVDFMAGRVMNTHVKVSGSPRIMADVYAGGEMSSVGWWDTNRYVGDYGTSAENSNHDVYYTNTGYSKVTIKDNPNTGTPYEFSTANYIDNRKAWTLVDGVGRLTHTCSGNVYGGGQGYVEEKATHRWNWVHMGRVRYTTVSISGGRFMGNVFGGGSRGVVKEDCNVTITGGRIGCVIHDESKDPDDNTKNKYVNQQYYYGSVFGGGYGNPKTFIHWNDSCFVATNGDSVKMIPTEQAGRVYGNTFVNISGGHIYDCVYGGGDMASTGYVERDLATGRYLFEDATKRHGGVCTVNITGTTIIGPLDGNGLNAYVYGSGKGVGYDPDETYKSCANVNEAHLTVSLTFTATPDSTLTDYGWNSATDGRIYGSLFGGGADCHVLGDVYTTLHSGLIGTAGTTSWDGNIFGAGRNYLNTNHTNGRVQGNVEVLMDGGILMGSIFGGGRMALTGIDVDGHFPTSSWDPTEHGNVDIQVRGNAIIGTHVSSDLLGAYESCGDIFGGGKGDCDPYKDIWAGRVSNVTITVKDDASGNSPRIHGGVFGGGEMASLGYWDDTITDGQGHVIFHTSSSDFTTPGTTYGTHYGTFYTGTGSATISITGGVVIGTFDELALYTKPTHENQAQRVYATAPYENPGEWTIYNADGTVLHTCTGNVYGGCQGDIDVMKPRWVSMGRSRTSKVTIGGGSDNPKIMGCVFGGAEQGIMTGDASVTINSGTIGTHVTTGSGATTNYIYGDVYGAGYGCDDASEWGDDNYQSTYEPHNDSTAGSQALHIGWNPGLLAGRTFGNATVDILGGHILGSVYGGGSFASLGDDKSTGYGASTSLYPVNGISTVNIGSRTAGNATIDGDVFGANNYKGTPYGGTHVNIYHTAHSGNNSYPDTVALKALAEPTNALTGADLAKQYEENTTMPQTFALRAVYGGGNKAAHTPIADDSASVHVWFCSENTIKDVYGGGNAAATKNNHVVIDGGRINRVFGGGNGYSATNNHSDPSAPNYNPGADVSGTAHTEIKGGIIDSVWGGSNQLGIILNTVLDVTHEDASCPEVINQTTGGGNESPGGGGTVTVRCGAYQENFYAGGSFADVGSPANPATVILNVEGGHITNLYAGCQGDKASYGTGHSDRPANIYGDVILNFYGGNVVNLFGGSHRNGNITGTITVNVDIDPDYTCTDGLRLDHVYGAGQDAAYTPTDPFRLSPTVNIMNNRVHRSGTSGTMADSAWVEIMDVYGGGLGTTATCTSYPCVVIGGFGSKLDSTNTGTEQNPVWDVTTRYTRGARVFGNVYGGGSAAPVIGNTIVMVRDATIGRDLPDPSLTSGIVYGGGYGTTAKVVGETYVGIFGLSDIKNNVYGGGNAGIVTGSTEIQIGYQKQIFPAEFIGFLDASDNNTLKGRFQCTTPGVKFRYTKKPSVEGIPSVTNGTIWDGTPFPFRWSDTIQVIAYLWDGDDTHGKLDSSMIPSFVAFDKAPAPVITIKQGTTMDTVILDGTIGARIRYTTDGSVPTHASTLYGNIGETNEEGATGTFTITHGGTQVVKAFVEMRGCYSSNVTALTAEKPVITFNETTNKFEITAAQAGDRIIYTTNLSTPTSAMSGTPTASGTEHGTKETYDGTHPIEVTVSASEDTTVKAIVERTGCLPSLIEAEVHRVVP